jgi:pilus assembly protein Flp/PilA
MAHFDPVPSGHWCGGAMAPIVAWPSLEGGNHPGGPNGMALINSFLMWLHQDDEGQGLAEYALILALIAIVAIVALIFLGSQVSGILNTVGKSV